MKQGMKQRLVGAVVLIALGIVIWPIVFDPSVVRRFSEESKIPPAPRFDEFSVPETDIDAGGNTPAEIEEAPINSENRSAESTARVKAAAQAGEATDEFGLPVL